VTDPQPAPDPTPEAREHWRRVWAENYEALTERLLAATDAESTHLGQCPRCRSRVPINHPDIRARTDAISKLHELAGLRPRPDDGTFATAPVVLRRLVLPNRGELEGSEAGCSPSAQGD
jgi:hypothetical protein